MSVKKLTTNRSQQTGIALLQVLLMSAILSLLSLQFNKTARDQIDIASQFDDRVKAQLFAYSSVNEVIFLQISDTVVPLLHDKGNGEGLLLDKARLNHFGNPVPWRENVTVVLQDLGGLLPLMFPNHFGWRKLLMRRSIDEEQLRIYFGLWQDIHDTDNRSWIAGDLEPVKLQNGGHYLNGFAQNSKVLEWLFADHPDLLVDLVNFSDIDAPYNTNFLFSPAPLIEALFDPLLAREILTLRKQADVPRGALMSLLPNDYPAEELSIYPSGRFKVGVTATFNGSRWSQEQTVRIAAAAKPPFNIILNN